MAGLNLLLNLSKADDFGGFKFIQGNGLLHQKDLWRTSNVVFNTFIHSGYPHVYFERNDYVIYLEGKVYNLSTEALQNKLEDLIHLLSKENINKELITDVLFNLDGDYVVVIYDKVRKKIFLLNDLYGRLPLYYGNNDGKFMISRNIDAVSQNLDLSILDKYGIGEILVFGHTVTDKTLIKGIHYFHPGSLVSIDLNQLNYNIQNIFTYNFEELVSVHSENYETKLEESIEVFKSSIAIRKGIKPVVGLSGGLDSRILAASFNVEDSDVEFVSRLSFNNREKKDIGIAKNVADLLGLKFQVIEPDKPSEELFYEIIRNKLGLNSIENDYNLIYEKLLQSKYGCNFTYFTGDAGDRIKPHIRIRKANSLMDFVEKIINVNSKFNVEQIARLLDISVETFKENIYEVLDSFPEKSFGYKDLHFRIYLRGFKYVLEGEDRKRDYFWTAMPHYGHDYFQSVMAFPDTYKRNLKMVFDVTNRLNPSLNDIVNKNWGMAPNDWRLPLYLMRNKIPRDFKLYIKKILKKTDSVKASDEILNVDDFSIETLFNKDVFREMRLESGSDRSQLLFLKTPILLNHYINNRIPNK